MKAFLALFCLLLVLPALSGCNYTTRSNLPTHIRTVEVKFFHNKTFYKNLEGRLTRQLIRRLNLDPQVRVVNDGGDAVIEGEILEVRKIPTRETTADRPAAVTLTIVAEYSFLDRVEGVYLVNRQRISSAESSSVAGQVQLDRGEVESDAEQRAVLSLADEIARRTVGQW